MEFTHDPNKETKNIHKHGVSLGDAEHLDWDSLQAKADTRHHYGELRMIGYAVGARACIALFLQTVALLATLSAYVRPITESR